MDESKCVVWNCGKDHGIILVPTGSRIICPCGVECVPAIERKAKAWIRECDNQQEVYFTRFSYDQPPSLGFRRAKWLDEP